MYACVSAVACPEVKGRYGVRMLAESIQPLLAPVVLVSACGLLTLSMNARTMTVKGRLREFHLERLELGDTVAAAGRATDNQRLRFESLGMQSGHLMRRLGLLRAALVGLVSGIVLLLVCMLLIGLSAQVSAAAAVAYGVFIAGVCSVLVAMVLFLAELRIALAEVRWEHERVMRLTLPSQTNGEPGGG